MNQGGTSETSDALTPAAPRFPVVGVGASAGGLAATTELLANLGPTPGLALIIVHHLDPTHPSSLVEILSRATPLPVSTAADGMPILANHVYVVPQNAGLLLEHGALRLTPRVETGRLHLPVDQLFESLAADRTTEAIGVVLTGTGSDGAEGIRAIKTEGGITFAQDAGAEYRGMPDAAMSTGCVDFVLTPVAIARELLRLGAHAPPPSTPQDDEPDFQRIVLALRKASGIDFTNYKPSTVRRRVQRRVLVHGLGTLREYAELLERSPEEAAALTEEALIHVTGFFRDPETFEALKTAALPRLLEDRSPDAPLRVWVPGCSTGEEVYSIAITLLEFLDDAKAGDLPLKLFGTDVSLRAIDKARAARYPASIEREVSPGRLQRFFTKTETGYQIRKDVRDLCVFARQDATRDPPFSGLDLISCRNLMIYLGSALQERLLPVFHYALKEPGFLVLGTSETIRSFPGFSAFDAKNKIYARTSATPRLMYDFTDRRLSEPPTAEAVMSELTRPSGPLEVHREADRLVMAEFAPPGVVVTDDLAIVQFRGRTGAFLEPTPGVASFDLLRMVREDLRIPVRQTVDEARATLQTTRREGLPMTLHGAPRVIDLEVIPFRAASTPQRYFVVLFKDVTPASLEAVGPKLLEPPPVPQSSVETQLAQELASTRDYLQAVIEQLEASNEELKAANEEIVSSNEELRSTNEELQMAKEELQATNEELRTVNDEMIVRNAEGTRVNDDLTNVLSSVEIPILILGRDSGLRRFTPAAARVFRLTAADVGRPIGTVEAKVHAAELTTMIGAVLERLGAVERTMQDESGRWYQLTVRPYLTLDNRIDGTVVTAVDVDTVKRGEQLLVEAQKYAESVVDTVRECLLVLDGDLRVRSANRAFCEAFETSTKDIEGRALHEVAKGGWNLPELRKRLRALDAGNTLEGFRVEQHGGAGRRTYQLNARRIEHSSSVLLALEDVTEREAAVVALERADAGYREMLMTAAEAIFMSDAQGCIVFANEMATKIFGYPAKELVGLPIERLVPQGIRERQAEHRASHAALATSRPLGADRNLVGRRRDGSEFPIEVILGSMGGADGQLVVSFITDASRRREAEQKIRDYQAKLQKMAFDAAVAEERERRRIAVDLHDRIGQSLALAQIKLTSVRGAIDGPPRAAIDEAVGLLAQSVSDTRSLTFELSPPVLYDLGLKEALAWLVEQIEKAHGLRVELVDDAKGKPLDDATAALVFRAVRELLMNVLKHAKATTARVSLRRTDDDIDIDVEDQGVGFDPSDLTQRAGSGGFGLFSVREQISRLGGTVDVDSAPDQGTRVRMRVPMKGKANHEDSPRG